MEFIFSILRYCHDLRHGALGNLDLDAPNLKGSLPVLMRKQVVQGLLGEFTPMERGDRRAGSSHFLILTLPSPHSFLYFPHADQCPV